MIENDPKQIYCTVDYSEKDFENFNCEKFSNFVNHWDNSQKFHICSDSYFRNSINLYYCLSAYNLNLCIELAGPGYQNVIDSEDYKLQYNFEPISKFNQ